MDTIRALGDLAEAPGPEQVRLAKLLELPGEPSRSEYTDLLIVQLHPYASVYLTPDGQRLGQLQDHLSHICAAYQQINGPLRQVFLWEHMISWLIPFCARARELAAPFYRAWATMLMDALEAEATRNGRPALVPLPLRNSNAFESLLLDDVVNALFAPVVSGLVLARADLSRCIRDLRLNVRVADRRYTLRTMFSEDRARVQQWLAEEAKRQADLLSAAPEIFAPIKTHWEKRALQTADVLDCMIVQKVPQ